MVKFSTYADVVSPDDFLEGKGEVPLKDVLEWNGGAYVHRHTLSERAKGDIRKLAEVTGDANLAQIAERSEIMISLEHFRGLDPNTRIRVGSKLEREPIDGPLPGFDR